jgi:FAD/FMN-containing dehydrogenase
MTTHPVTSAPNGSLVAPALEAAAIGELRADFRGSLLLPGDPGYEERRRVWNGTIDRHPAVIARCAGVVDVIRTVNFARERGLRLAVRGGGHNIAGSAVCDDGVVIDLSGMRSIRVDPARRTARVEGGATWGELDRETHAFGLATTGGVVSTTGVGGLTLGGGIGWLARSYGLASDNLVSVDVVTADGELRTASATEDPDLFWGLRGGGGNFGVATSLEYRLHPVREVIGGLLIHPYGAARDLLRFYLAFTASAPPALTCFAVLGSSPDGQPVAILAACYHGPAAEGERLLRPLRTFGSPLVDGIGPMPYPALQSMLDQSYPPGLFHYWKSSFLTALDDDAIDTMVAQAAERPTPMCHLVIEQMGGEVSRLDADATAFAHRHRPYNLLILGTAADRADVDACTGWARRCWVAMQPSVAEGVYVNYIGTEGDEGSNRVREAYGAAKYERLARLKTRYDPTNLFRVNQNIRPT